MEQYRTFKYMKVAQAMRYCLVENYHFLNKQTWKHAESQKQFSTTSGFRLRSNIDLVSDSLPRKTLYLTCSEKDRPLNRNFYTKPYFRVSFWEAELVKVARLPGQILRWGFSTRPGSSRFLAPSVLFQEWTVSENGFKQTRKHITIFRQERKKEKKRKKNN